MAKVIKKSKKVKLKKGETKEIFDLEIDEVSAVDMAAIGESFYITKSVNNKKGAKVAKKKKLPLIKAMPKWSENLEKADSDKCGEHCHFCGVTKAVEEETMGAGLRNGVCIGCALEHFEKGVFDDCMDFKFDIEEFKTKFPDVKLHEVSTQKNEDESDDDSDEEEDEDGEEDADKDSDKDEKDADKDADKKDSEEDEDEDEDDSDEEEDEDSEKNKAAGDSATGDEENSNQDSELNNGELSKRVIKLEKSLEDVTGMLERSLELHEVSAGAFNEVVTLTFASIDMLMAMMEERKEEDNESEAGKAQSELFTSINDSIKSVRLEVSKAGAKISGKRMAVLREIATKLSELIESVLGSADAKKDMTKSALTEVQKSLNSVKEDLQKSIADSASSLKEDIDEKLKEVNTKLEDIEQSGGASFNLGDDEEDDTEEEEEVEKGESVFSNVLGLDEVTKSIKRKQRNLTK